MDRYLIFTDLDGTLLTSNKTIGDYSISYIKDFVNSNNLFCIATGRPKQTCIDYYNAIGAKVPLITDNGAAIRFIEGLNLYFEIPYDIWMSFLADTKGMDKMIYMTTREDFSYSHNRNLLPDWIKPKENADFKIIDGDILDICKTSPLVCNFFVKRECIEEFKKILEKYKKNIMSIIWKVFDDECYNVELRCVNATKGHALEYVRKHFGISKEFTMAFGDELNDIEMINTAGYGVAVKNAVAIVKNSAGYITEYDNDNDGVVRFIDSIVK